MKIKVKKSVEPTRVSEDPELLKSLLKPGVIFYCVSNYGDKAVYRVLDDGSFLCLHCGLTADWDWLKDSECSVQILEYNKIKLVVG